METVITEKLVYYMAGMCVCVCVGDTWESIGVGHEEG